MSFILVDAEISVTHRQVYPEVSGVVVQRHFEGAQLIAVRVERESLPESLSNLLLDDVVFIKPHEVRGTLPKGTSPEEVEAWLAS